MDPEFLPDEPGISINTEVENFQVGSRASIFHFPDRLGRLAIHNFPGWFRSFTFSVVIARKLNLKKIVHIESDCFHSERTRRWNSSTPRQAAGWRFGARESRMSRDRLSGHLRRQFRVFGRGARFLIRHAISPTESWKRHCLTRGSTNRFVETGTVSFAVKCQVMRILPHR